MDPDDARLCLERHATSKIQRADDLGAIVTLGFRGEALPSIASVSHFRLRHARAAAASGTEIRVNAGIIESVVEAGGPEGTMVEVADVFYNLPARRKFLKSDAAEAAQVSRFVTQLALCYPEVGFTLTSSGRKVHRGAAGDELWPTGCISSTAIARTWSRSIASSAGVRLHGFIAALAEQGPTRGPQHVFVNRRIVKDRTIAHAIIDAYSVATNKERSPEVHLFLEMPPDRVDVNVHPTKAEVRFREQSHGPRARSPRARRRAWAGAGAGTHAAPSDVPAGPPDCSRRFPALLRAESFPSRWAAGFSRRFCRVRRRFTVVWNLRA